MTVNVELGRAWQETAQAYFNVQFQHSFRATEESHGDTEVQYSATGLRGKCKGKGNL
jgi:hypothetical protein